MWYIQSSTIPNFTRHGLPESGGGIGDGFLHIYIHYIYYIYTIYIYTIYIHLCIHKDCAILHIHMDGDNPLDIR